jgi:hypothetical protein
MPQNTSANRKAFRFPALTEKDAVPARRLWVEIATRITTQRLRYRSGDEETAAKTIHSLFETTGNLLVEFGPCEAFDFASLFMLNRVIRPCTARWHRWLENDCFRSELARREFRKEWSGLQERLQPFGKLFDSIAFGQTPGNELLEECFGKLSDGEIVIEEESGSGLAEMGTDVIAGIGSQIPFFMPEKDSSAAAKFVTPAEINAAEREVILTRRATMGRSASGELVNATGLCLSGGGIRSATFCLGIAQVLAERGMLAQMDYLSTVSGGGYFGSFLSSYLGVSPAQLKSRLEEQASPKAAPSTEPAGAKTSGQPAPPQADPGTRIREAFAPRPDGKESRAVRHLRNNSRYLLNGGLWARVRIVGLLLSGVLTNLLASLQVPLIAVLAVFGLQEIGYWHAENDRWAPWRHGDPSMLFQSVAGKILWLCGATFVVAWIFLALVQNATHRAPPTSGAAKFRTGWITATLALALMTATAAALYCLPAITRWYAHLRGLVSSVGSISLPEQTVGIITAAAPFILGPLAARVGGGGRAKKLLALLFAISGPLLLFFIFLFVGSRVLLPGEVVWPWEALAFVTLGLVVWSWLTLNINTHGPHLYYRDRLCECYLATRDAAQDQSGLMRGLMQSLAHGRPREERELGTLQRVPLSALCTDPAAPYHLINTTVNVPSSRDPNLRGRDSDFFMFSPRFCGGPVCGYISTKDLERLDPHFDLGTAMAVSGAAASSNMGVKTMRNFRFLLTLVNIRLGYWLRNPRQRALGFISRIFGAPGPGYLFAEAVGWMHERKRFLNLSDGGHIENLAVYELLRRRCKYLVVVDAGQEPGMECADLLLVQRYAAIDLGVEMQFDLSDLMLDEKKTSRAYAVLGKIFYEPEKEHGALGWLVYIKLAVVGAEPAYVGDYRRQYPDFPHQSTGDQIYEEAQFEAYRALGEAAARSLFDEELTQPFRSAKARQRTGRAGGNGSGDISTIEDWFQAMATSLLPDNDRAFPAKTQAAI